MVRRRRYARRRRALKRAYRPRMIIRRGGRLRRSGGFLNLKRKIPELNIYNTATLGTYGTNLTTNNPFQSGAAQPTAFSGYYNIPFAFAAKLEDVINFSDITQLCDSYKLKWAKIRIWCTSSTASTGSTAQLPSILYRTDSDDNTFPTTVDSIREDMNSKCRVFYPGKPVVIFVPLKGQIRNDSTVAGNQGGPIITRPRWINSTYSRSLHFGLKFWLMDVNLNTTPNTNTQFRFDITYGISGKDFQ